VLFRSLADLRAEVDEKDRRIEELESLCENTYDNIQAWIKRGAKHKVWIESDKIDAAWEFNEDSSRDTKAHGRGLLYCIGIVECPECGGSGSIYEEDQRDEPIVTLRYDCPRCHGHGWIREEHGDE
jgi:hypothetical protein